MVKRHMKIIYDFIYKQMSKFIYKFLFYNRDVNMTICKRNATTYQISLIIVWRKSSFGEFCGMQLLLPTQYIMKFGACHFFIDQTFHILIVPNIFRHEGPFNTFCCFLLLIFGE